MELTIHGSIMIQFSIVTQHRNSNWKINRKKSSIQIGVMHNFSRFGSIWKYFRINLVVTIICRTMKSNLIKIDNISENKQI
jgi:hypothetical protein